MPTSPEELWLQKEAKKKVKKKLRFAVLLNLQFNCYA